MLQRSPNRRTIKQAAYRQRRRERKWVYYVPLREPVVDEAIDALIRDGLPLSEQQRHDPRKVGKALAPFFEHCLRQYRDRRLTVQIVNLFGCPRRRLTNKL